MLKRTIFAWGVAALVLSCQTWKIGEPSTVVVPDRFVALCPTHGDLDALDVRQIRTWNVRAVRQGFFWGAVEPRRGVWDFAWTDRYVEAATRAGAEVLAVLDYDVDWLEYPSSDRPRIRPEHVPLFLEYVAKLVDRYRNKPVSFEVWNEPNLAMFWKGTRAEFKDLAKSTIQTIRAENPNAKIVVGSLSQSPGDWVSDLLDLYTEAPYDSFSFHPYDLNEEWSVHQIVRVRSELVRRGIPVDLLLTEIGYPTRGWYVTKTDLNGQSDRLIKLYVSAAALGVKQAYWYASQDYNVPEHADDNSEAHFGLSYPDGREKPAAKSFALMAEILNGSVYRGSLATADRTSVASFRFEKSDGTVAIVLWNRGWGSASVVFRSGVGNLVDPYTLVKTRIEAGASIEVGAKPVVAIVSAGESKLFDEIGSVVQIFQ